MTSLILTAVGVSLLAGFAVAFALIALMSFIARLVATQPRDNVDGHGDQDGRKQEREDSLSQHG